MGHSRDDRHLDARRRPGIGCGVSRRRTFRPGPTPRVRLAIEEQIVRYTAQLDGAEGSFWVAMTACRRISVRIAKKATAVSCGPAQWLGCG